jgi:hypothetical protein
MAFHLGKRVGGDGARVEYDPKHLTTHGLVFGMTGSGKTGLCVGLLEEAGRENIPIIAIDPKGDLTNLALCWPDLAPQRFAEWIDPSRVQNEGPTAAELGEKMAATWRGGLAREGIDEEEIGAYRAGTNVTIYTPGSSSGVQVSLLDRFDPPPKFDTLTAEDQSELVTGVVSAVLALVDVDADPLQSREYILLSNLLTHAWTRGQALDLASLIQLIDAPPFDRLGVFDLEDFFPAKKRKTFAMQLNGLIASPSFQPWLRGVPLDMDAMLDRGDGDVSRTSIFYIAHLDDSERMSFVSLLLDRLIGWMRAQPGTGALRALVYMDEVFGYLPPHPLNPPTKRPLLTLLKQARAYGLGVLLATQNPVDIDYKAITNAGTWFVGKLQTEQDKERILDGLVSASAEVGHRVSRSEISRGVSALETRQFLLHNAHDSEQAVFSTRFVRSYLRGPMTKQEITRLKAVDFYNLGPARLRPAAPPTARPARAPHAEVVDASFGGHRETHTPAPTGGEFVELDSHPATPTGDLAASMLRRNSPAPAVPGGRPIILGVDERFLSSAARQTPALQELFGARASQLGGRTSYRPALMAQARLTFEVEDGASVSQGTVTRIAFPIPATPGAVGWLIADTRIGQEHLVGGPEDAHALYTAPPSWLSSPADRERARDIFVRGLLDTQRLSVPACPPLSRYGEPGESLDTFRHRLATLLSQVTAQAVDRMDGQKAVEAGIWDRQVAEMRELLEADKREIGYYKQLGDAEAAEKAANRARFRIERYKELLGQRERFLGLHDRDMADVEFSAIDKLEACRMVDLTLRPQGITAAFFGLLWVPI